MVEPFYKEIDVNSTAYWKHIDGYELFQPEIARGNNSLIYYTKSNDEKLIMKTYTVKWVEENKALLKNELCNFNKLSPLGLVNPLLKKPFRTNKTIYLLLSFSNCGSLSAHIQESQPFPEYIIREIASFLAVALVQLKGSSMVHGNIKPEHVLVTVNEDGKRTYKLSGIKYCKDMASTMFDVLPDVTDYSAPELIINSPCHYSIDIWSVGATLYKLATGKSLSEVDPNFRVRIANDEPLFYKPNSHIDTTLCALIRRCLMHNPGDRITPQQILENPFVVGQSAVPRAVSLAGGSGSAKLLDIVTSDFNKYMSLMSYTKKHKFTLKCDKRASMSPYAFKASGSSREFGQIYYCTCEGAECVLKMVKTSRFHDTKMANLMLNELEELVHLNQANKSPYIIELKDFFTYKNDLCFIFEKYNGGNLEEYIRSRLINKKPLEYEEKLFLAYSILKGVDAISNEGILHKNLHPSNIFLGISKDGAIERVVIGGFIRFHSEDHKAFSLAVYKAPEAQVSDVATDIRFKADIWSYGMILYLIIFEIPANKLPENSNVHQTGKVVYDHRKLKQNMKPELFKAMLSCLKIYPYDRPSSSKLLKLSLFESFNSQ
eukprot:TRINITY_DN4169_c0_g3_i1.p1 TRINITY_DN4169_c0_g3~~TRINITY_DN4169_c0_g3_i1.p1  ORF type:complete len:603 (+),score=81.27 TRINITY_DN4169_c0_g3_i1:111-1919(+)